MKSLMIIAGAMALASCATTRRDVKANAAEAQRDRDASVAEAKADARENAVTSGDVTRPMKEAGRDISAASKELGADTREAIGADGRPVANDEMVEVDADLSLGQKIRKSLCPVYALESKKLAYTRGTKSYAKILQAKDDKTEDDRKCLSSIDRAKEKGYRIIK